MTPKIKIRDRFASAAPTYDGHAAAQRVAAQHLTVAVQGMLAHMTPDRVLEFGCGTGLLTRYLCEAYPQIQLTLNDIAPALVETTAAQVKGITPDCIAGDAEITFFPDPPYDLILGNMTLHWFQDPLSGIAHLAHQTDCLAFTTLCRGTFAAWQAVHDDLHLAAGLQPLLAAEDYRDMLHTLQARELHITEHRIDQPYESGLHFLRALKNLGAHTAHDTHAPVNLRPVLQRFADGFTARYHVLCAVLRL